jgi:hypothetical protein
VWPEPVELKVSPRSGNEFFQRSAFQVSIRTLDLPPRSIFEKAGSTKDFVDTDNKASKVTWCGLNDFGLLKNPVIQSSDFFAQSGKFLNTRIPAFFLFSFITPELIDENFENSVCRNTGVIRHFFDSLGSGFFESYRELFLLHRLLYSSNIGLTDTSITVFEKLGVFKKANHPETGSTSGLKAI